MPEQFECTASECTASIATLYSLYEAEYINVVHMHIYKANYFSLYTSCVMLKVTQSV